MRAVDPIADFVVSTSSSLGCNTYKTLLWAPEVQFFFRKERAVKTERRKIRTSGHGGLESHFHANSEKDILPNRFSTVMSMLYPIQVLWE